MRADTASGADGSVPEQFGPFLFFSLPCFRFILMRGTYFCLQKLLASLRSNRRAGSGAGRGSLPPCTHATLILTWLCLFPSLKRTTVPLGSS